MRFPTTALVLILATTATLAPAQDLEEWRIERTRWSGLVGAASVVEVRNEHGDVRCRLTEGQEIQVSAVIQSHLEDPYEARLEVTEQDDGLHIEVVYEPREDEAGGSLPEGVERRRVDMTVLVPAGPRLDLSTDDGLIEAKGVRNDVRARSLTGDVKVSTEGTVDARSERGALDITLQNTDWSAPPRLETLTGPVTVWLPAELDATVEAATEGIISTDFTIRITSEAAGRRKTASAVIGDGTRRLSISSIKGDVRLFRLAG